MIGLLHGGALGDFVLAWQLLESVKREPRDGESVIVARGPVAATAAALWRACAVHDAESAGVHGLFAKEPLPADSPVRRALARCDVVLNLLTGADHPAAEKLAACVAGAVYSIESRASGDPKHITEQWRGRLADAGLALGEASAAQVAVDEAQRCAARERLESAADKSDGPIVLLHPGSGGRRKCWPLDYFVELAELLREGGRRPVFLWGPVEEETWSAAEAARIRRGACVVPRDLTSALYLAAATDCYVGNDSGMTHGAAATGTRTVAVFGATDPRVWRPLGAKVAVLGTATGWPCVADVLGAVG